jgi:hypothetical protein
MRGSIGLLSCAWAAEIFPERERQARAEQVRQCSGMTPERRSVEAQDRFLDLLTASGCEVAVDANASEPSFLQYSKRTDVIRGRSGVQWTFGSLGKKNL